MHNGFWIGLSSSAKLCDLVFLNLVEKSRVLNSDSRKEIGICHYARYRDDVFVCVFLSHARKFQHMLSRMRALCAGIYKLELESISSRVINYLDVSVLSLPNGTFSYMLYNKNQ